MSSHFAQKRKRQDATGKRQPAAGNKRLLPPKKRMRAADYHSSSSEEEDSEDERIRARIRKDGALNGLESDGPRDEGAAQPAEVKPLEEDEDASDVEWDEDDEFEGNELDDALDNEPEEKPTSIPKDAIEAPTAHADSESEDANSADESDSSSASSNDQPTTTRPLKRRHDPDTFASSLSAILSAPLTTTQRANPVLARSKVASTTLQEIADARLEAKAQRRLGAERKALRDRGRVTDVLGVGGDAKAGEGDADAGTAAEVAALEKRLKKTAQRGVVKLFNAVRAAQVQAEAAEREAVGVVGAERRKERVDEMSKGAFLGLLAGDGA